MDVLTLSKLSFITSCKYEACKRSQHGLHPQTLRILHDESFLTAKFILDFYEAPEWTVFPTGSYTKSPENASGNARLFILVICDPQSC